MTRVPLTDSERLMQILIWSRVLRDNSHSIPVTKKAKAARQRSHERHGLVSCEAACESRYVELLQRINTRVFMRPDELMENMVRVTTIFNNGWFH